MNEEYYGVKLDIRATGALTFRRMPSAILHISSYPFIPPTTLSGWLRRLWLLSNGILPKTTVKKPQFYAMPQEFHVLGGYPVLGDAEIVQSTRMAGKCIHVARRQGVRAFNHDAFSRLSGGRAKHEVYQLHTWEYLTVDSFQGFVLHREFEPLRKLCDLVNFGCKCGKEGYAFLEAVSSVKKFVRQVRVASPSVPASGKELLGQPADMFVAYRHEYDSTFEDPSPGAYEPSPISGFVSTWLGWPSREAELAYLTDGEYFIPAGMVEVF